MPRRNASSLKAVPILTVKGGANANHDFTAGFGSALNAFGQLRQRAIKRRHIHDTADPAARCGAFCCALIGL